MRPAFFINFFFWLFCPLFTCGAIFFVDFWIFFFIIKKMRAALQRPAMRIISLSLISLMKNCDWLTGACWYLTFGVFCPWMQQNFLCTLLGKTCKLSWCGLMVTSQFQLCGYEINFHLDLKGKTLIFKLYELSTNNKNICKLKY